MAVRSGSGNLSVPDGLLQRHGARVLRPTDAVAVAGAPIPASTVYRSGVLLFADDVVRNRDLLAELGDVLAPLGVALRVPDSVQPTGHDPEMFHGRSWHAEFGVPAGFACTGRGRRSRRD